MDSKRCSTPGSLHRFPAYSRSSVEIEAAFFLNVKHQVASIQVLHYKEEMLLRKQDVAVRHK